MNSQSAFAILAELAANCEDSCERCQFVEMIARAKVAGTDIESTCIAAMVDDAAFALEHSRSAPV